MPDAIPPPLRAPALAIAAGRVVIGIIFVWAGLEKLIGEASWTAAGSLKSGTAGTLAGPFVTGEIPQGKVFNPTHDSWV